MINSNSEVDGFKMQTSAQKIIASTHENCNRKSLKSMGSLSRSELRGNLEKDMIF